MNIPKSNLPRETSPDNDSPLKGMTRKEYLEFTLMHNVKREFYHPEFFGYTVKRLMDALFEMTRTNYSPLKTKSNILNNC